MAMTPATQKMLMDTLRVSQPQSIAAPLSPFEQIEAQRGLLSTDPVVANLQKLGRGAKSLLEPQSAMDYLGFLTGAGIIKGAKVIKDIGQGMLDKASVPKTVFHGSPPSREKLTEITSANFRMPNPSERLQSAIFTTTDKRLARKYGSYDPENVYEIDLSDVSKLQNLLNIGKNQVLNTSKPNSKFINNLDRKIKELSKSDKNKVKVKSLQTFKDQLGEDKYVSRVGPTVKNFLLENNIKLLRTNPTKYNLENAPGKNFSEGVKDTYILLQDSVPVK